MCEFIAQYRHTHHTASPKTKQQTINLIWKTYWHWIPMTKRKSPFTHFIYDTSNRNLLSLQHIGETIFMTKHLPRYSVAAAQFPRARHTVDQSGRESESARDRPSNECKTVHVSMRFNAMRCESNTPPPPTFFRKTTNATQRCKREPLEKNTQINK